MTRHQKNCGDKTQEYFYTSNIFLVTLIILTAQIKQLDDGDDGDDDYSDVTDDDDGDDGENDDEDLRHSEGGGGEGVGLLEEDLIRRGQPW